MKDLQHICRRESDDVEIEEIKEIMNRNFEIIAAEIQQVQNKIEQLEILSQMIGRPYG